LIADFLINKETTKDDIEGLKAVIGSFAPEEVHKKRVSMLLGILNIEDSLRAVLDGETLASFNLVIGRINQLLNAFKAANTYIFPKGEIEHYYTRSNINYLNINNKDAWFHAERDYLLQTTDMECIKTDYSQLVEILMVAVPVIDIEVKKHIKFEIFEWIHKVQTGIAKGEITGVEDLQRNAKINYSLYNQILELVSLTINDDLTFESEIRIRESVINESVLVRFNQETNAHTFEV
jgi:hypothetical protein